MIWDDLAQKSDYPIVVATAEQDEAGEASDRLQYLQFADEDAAAYTTEFDAAQKFENMADALRAANTALIQGRWVSIHVSDLDWNGEP